jgi:hypothetical protein
MNVLHGRGFETILTSLMLLLLPPLSQKTLGMLYLLKIRLIRCMRSWKILTGTKFGSWWILRRGVPIEIKWVWKNRGRVRTGSEKQVEVGGARV